ncbi:MAG: universal stress protein [Chloroflexi bacterium]|nr:universal stress protein [Chloroflexota bacterium]OJV92867.1 MAG: hypothetical protein BGO39_30400 [Chloroflexi bacterium 54-19]
MYQHLMVPLDGSALAGQALPYATSLLQHSQAKLTLLQVVELPPVLQGSLDSEAIIKSAETYLQQVKVFITAPRLARPIQAERVQIKVAFGNPKYEVGAQASAIKADLIVMTTHGRSGLAQLIMGSVAASVIQHTNIPVLSIRPSTGNGRLPLSESLAIPFDFRLERDQGGLLVTLDGTPESEVVLEPAISLAQTIGIPLHLLRVVPPLVPFSYGDIAARYGKVIGEELDRQIREADQYLDQLQERISTKGLACSRTIQIGDVTAEILGFAKKTHPALLAMATRGRGRIGQILLGSVAEGVARHCRLPVLLVHIPTHVALQSGARSNVTA